MATLLLAAGPAHPLVAGEPAGAVCKNTVQGLYYLADTQGQLCRRSSADWSTGCCRFAELEACLGCDATSKCCEEFEMCVSCCMQPANDAAGAMLVSPRGNNKPETGYFSQPFDYCRAKCRTNSKSTLHENAYKSAQHHCYGPQPGETVPVTPRATRANLPVPATPRPVPNFKPVVSNQGESCTQACARTHSRCLVNALPALNTCDKLREHLPCEGGCQESFGPDQPAYVVNTVMRMHNPGACMVNTHLPTLSCAGAHQNTKRLCACSPDTSGSSNPAS